MKKVKILILFLITISFKAQTLPIFGHKGAFNKPGAYYSDLDDDFTKFVGAWKWQDGNSSLEIHLIKKTNVYDPSRNANFDVIVGEYQFIDNTGTLIINTIPNLNDPNISVFDHNICGHFISRPALAINPNYVEYRTLSLLFDDPERKYLFNSIKIKYINFMGERIEVNISGEEGVFINEALPTQMRIPDGKYILEKI